MVLQCFKRRRRLMLSHRDMTGAARSARWWATGVAKALVAFAVVYAPLAWFAGHYRIVYDSIQGANCLPYSVFLVDLDDRALDRGAYVAFVSKQMEPFYANGTIAVKLVAGQSGDRVTVNEGGVSINGRHFGVLVHLNRGEKLWQMGRRVEDVERDEQVPKGHLWMMGTNPRSYDSRYWGYIQAEQVIGRAIPLW
jgi:conjugal transfer pilin signal peptidase TrbI